MAVRLLVGRAHDLPLHGHPRVDAPRHLEELGHPVLEAPGVEGPAQDGVGPGGKGGGLHRGPLVGAEHHEDRDVAGGGKGPDLLDRVGQALVGEQAAQHDAAAVVPGQGVEQVAHRGLLFQAAELALEDGGLEEEAPAVEAGDEDIRHGATAKDKDAILRPGASQGNGACGDARM